MNDYSTLIDRLMNEADLCRNDDANDVADLLNEAAAAVLRLTKSNHAAGGKLALVRVWDMDEYEEVAPGEYQAKCELHDG